MKRNGRHHFHVNRRGETEDQAPHYDPFTATEPCKCGSRERVYNGRSATFCQRCGRKHGEAPPPQQVGVVRLDPATVRRLVITTRVVCDERIGNASIHMREDDLYGASE